VLIMEVLPVRLQVVSSRVCRSWRSATQIEVLTFRRSTEVSLTNTHGTLSQEDHQDRAEEEVLRLLRRHLQVSRVSLPQLVLTSKIIDSLKEMSNLRHLSQAHGINVPPDIYSELCAAIGPTLSRLDSVRLTDRHIPVLTLNLIGLQRLQIYNSPELYNNGLALLATLPSLSKLMLRECQNTTPHGLSPLITEKVGTPLSSLEIVHCPQLVRIEIDRQMGRLGFEMKIVWENISFWKAAATRIDYCLTITGIDG